MTYSNKVKQIKVIRDYLVTLLTGILTTAVKTTRAQLLSDTDFPMLGVVYSEGTNEDIRQIGNSNLTYHVVYRNRVQDEMDELDVVAQIAAKFEDTSLGDKCIGCVPHLPTISVESTGDTATFESVIELTIEI
jgi:hypothetical protein